MSFPCALHMSQVLTDLEDIHAVPVYFVEGISFMDPPSKAYEGAGNQGGIIEEPHIFIYECMCVRRDMCDRLVSAPCTGTSNVGKPPGMVHAYPIRPQPPEICKLHAPLPIIMDANLLMCPPRSQPAALCPVLQPL